MADKSPAVQHLEDFIAWMRSKEQEFVFVAEGPDGAIGHRLDINELDTVLAAAKEDREGFLSTADRAVQGWRRANKNQIDNIGRLQEELRVARVDRSQMYRTNVALADKLDEVVRIVTMWSEMGPELGTNPAKVLEIKLQLHKAIST
jgi:hypothetical protein